MTRAISLHSVSKVYSRSTRAVDRFSLDISPGEFVVLLGPSGCGKSTVLRMIAGLEEITEGELLLDGVYSNLMPTRERGMAMVFQNFALYPNMTNRENIGFPLRLENPRAATAERVQATARMLGIESVLDRYPSQLSGGERQRVAMGRAISRRPSAFLMDEPLSNLDAKMRGRLRAEMARLTAELGVTTVYVTHDQAEAMSLGDRVAVMRGGVLQQVSSPREVYALPENVFVAAFIGTPRINLLQAAVYAPLDGRMSIDLGRQRLPLPEPLSSDHQSLRLQQGRRIIVGLRSEAARIAAPSQARSGEVALSGIVEHMEYQGHEALVHLDIGSTPAAVTDLESPAPAPASRTGQRRRGHGGRKPGVLARIRGRVTGYNGGSGAALDEPEEAEGPAYGPTNGPTGAPPYGQAVGPARGDASGLAPGQGRDRQGRDRLGQDRQGHDQDRQGHDRQDRPAIAASDLVVRTGPDMRLRTGAQVPLLVDLAHLYVFDDFGRRICPAPRKLPGLGP